MNKFLDKIKLFIKANSEIVTPTAVLAIICVVITLALSSTNLLTKDKIKEIEKETQKAGMKKVLPADDYEADNLTITDEKTKEETTVEYHKAVKDDRIVGYIFSVKANGYGGKDSVSVMTAVSTDCKVISVNILDASGETPGLGQNVTNEDFYNQFTGLSGKITAKKSGAANKENNEIDAVTAATISSKAVTDAVNKALDYAEVVVASEDEVHIISEEIFYPEGDGL